MVKDLATDENGSFIFENGDFVVKESDIQHISDILNSEKGEWKEHPFVGVGILNYLNGPLTGLETEINKQLKEDGYINVITEIRDNKLTKLNAFRP